MSQKRYEPFKESLKSLCRDCFNIQSDCFHTSKSCETDSKIGKSYVKKCGSFNKDLTPRKTNSNIITVENVADSRIEMMGGGFVEK